MDAVVSDYLLRVDSLIRKGREVRSIAANHADTAATVSVRLWQQDCAELVNELSGGSKAHWLARAFSEAFLVRSSAAEAIAEAPLTDIVERLVTVLERARGSLSQIASDPATAAAASRPHRFDFVSNTALRPVLEQALVEAQAALDQGQFAKSMLTTCGILEAIITDALEHGGEDPRELSFEARIEAAE